MIKLKTAILLFVMMGLFSFTSKESQLYQSNSMDTKDISADLLRKELQANNGQLVLISFWASYDASSRIENIKCANLMKTFANKKFNQAEGFVVLSVSLDSYSSVFEETIKRDRVAFIKNIHATKGLESEIAHNYKLGENLGNVLLDAQGHVIAKNLSINALKEILESKQTN